jgi:hypothetical protein
LLCADGYPTIDGKRLVLRGDLIGWYSNKCIC